jgi:4a-hydroxytetrahydrobiopterin dehydratase
MRALRLSEGKIAAGLANLPGWTRAGQTISRTYSFESFAQAMAFVSQVAKEAERMDHHPDIDIRYDQVTLALTTHHLTALTAKDVTLAGICDDLASGLTQ